MQMKAIFEYRSIFECSVEKLFSFHEDKVGFEILVGLDKSVKVIQPPESISKSGAQAILDVGLLPGIRKIWVAEHTSYIKNELFIDIQKSGPFNSFRHEHRFSRNGVYSELNDHIEFEFFMNFVSKYFVIQKLKSQFQARHEATAKYLGVNFKTNFKGMVS